LKRSDSFGWKIINFSDEGLHGMTTEEQYNDFVVLNEWINEFWQNKGQFKIIRLIQPEMDELMDRYGASTVSMTAVLNIENLTQSHLGNLVFFPIMPISVYKHFSHTEQTLMETLVVDAREGKVITRETYSYNEADQSALVDAMVYDISKKSLKGEKNPVGMLGLRCAITGGGQLSMAGLQPFDIGTILSINPWVNIEYALSRKLTLTAGWTRQGGFEELNKTTPDLSKDMTTWSLALRFYSHTDFAPLGSYACAGIHMVHFTNMSDNSDGGNTFGLHFGAGRNYVFFERILLNIEARYSYTYGVLDFFKSVGGNDFGGRKYMADAFLANLIVFRLGIGILPF
jgi:opacity protein-like surface antigen